MYGAGPGINSGLLNQLSDLISNFTRFESDNIEKQQREGGEGEGDCLNYFSRNTIQFLRAIHISK